MRKVTVTDNSEKIALRMQQLCGCDFKTAVNMLIKFGGEHAIAQVEAIFQQRAIAPPPKTQPPPEPAKKQGAAWLKNL